MILFLVEELQSALKKKKGLTGFMEVGLEDMQIQRGLSKKLKCQRDQQ
jgi:hypothetical protein